MTPEPAPKRPLDWRVPVAVLIGAIVLVAPIRAPEGENPWPVTLALAAVFLGVAAGGAIVLWRSPPAPDE